MTVSTPVPDDAALLALAMRVGERLQERGWMLALAESCTGGWAAKVATDAVGSSAWLDRGYVTYSNQAKREMLGVSDQTLAVYGAVSEATVREMAMGAQMRGGADVSVAISGIAGPGGGTEQKPVGTVWFAWMARGDAPKTARLQFDGDRETVRRQAVAQALQGILDLMDG